MDEMVQKTMESQHNFSGKSMMLGPKHDKKTRAYECAS